MMEAAATALEPPAAPSLPTLQQLCVRAVASTARAGGTSGAVALAPPELRQEVLLLLARWGLLTPPVAEPELHWAELLPSLEALSLAHCALLTSEALQRAFESAGPLPRLASLSLRGVPRLADAACAAVLRCCPALTGLDVSKCPLVAEQAIAAAGGLRALTSVNLAQCWRVEDLSPLSALRLASLNMGGCHRVSGRSLRQVIEASATALQELSLSGWRGISDPEHSVLRLPLPALRALHASATDIDAPALACMAAWSAASLQRLTLADCDCERVWAGLAALLCAKAALLVAEAATTLPLLELSAPGLQLRGSPPVCDVATWLAGELAVCQARVPRQLHQALAAAMPGWPRAPQLMRASAPLAFPDSVAGLLACLGAPGLRRLEALDVGAAAGDALLHLLASAPAASLTQLAIAGGRVSQEALDALLSRLPALRRLDVAGCVAERRVARPGSRFAAAAGAKRERRGGVHSLAALAACPQLQSLSAGGLLITDDSLVGQAGLSALSLRGCARVTDGGLLRALQQCPSLRRLDAAGASLLTPGALGCWAAHDGGGARSSVAHVSLERAALPKHAAADPVLAWLAGQAQPAAEPALGAQWRGLGAPAGCVALRRLELGGGGAAAATDVGLQALLARAPLLTSLSLGGAPGLTATALCAALARHCPLLSRLALPGWAQLQDDEAAALLALPCLQQLDFGGCSAVGDAALRALRPDGSPCVLRSARLDDTRVSDAGARLLTEACADLETLSLRRCARVTDVTALAALSSCANLRNLLLGGTAVAGDGLRGLMQRGEGELWPDGMAATSLRRLELPPRAVAGVCWPPGLSVSAG